jgi:hypothetical protein
MESRMSIKRKWRSRTNRYNVLCLLFFLSFFLLFCSGRLASGDAGTQLQAAMLLANTGKPAIVTPPAEPEAGLWVRNQDGDYYQAHDIGNMILMFPAAAAGSALSQAPAAQDIQSPPILSRVGVSMTYACVSAIGVFFMFLLFSLFATRRTAFLLSLAFATTTFFWAYAKSSWDVMGACVGVCMLLYLSARLLHEEPVQNTTVVLSGCALAFASSFRYSLLPFLILGVLVFFYLAREKFEWRHVAVFLIAAFFGLVPTFIYNFVRMGSVLRPATTAPQFDEGNALGGNVVQGLYGLMLSPNKGIFIFAPILLLLFAVPFTWNRFPLSAPRLILSFSIGAALYVLLIAKLNNWGAFGWGPRYMLPILPVLFFAVGMTLVSLWGRYRYPLMLLIFVSLVLNAAPALVNWHLALSEYPRAANEYAYLPYQHAAVWNGIQLAAQGQPLPAPPDIANDPIRSGGARFPDLWTFRLMERSMLGLIAGLAISLVLLSISLGYFRELAASRYDGGG